MEIAFLFNCRLQHTMTTKCQGEKLRSAEARAWRKQSRVEEVTSGRQKRGDEAQMSHYVADKVRANRACIKNLFQNPDGSSICVEPAQHERTLEMSTHMTARSGRRQGDKNENKKAFFLLTFLPFSHKLAHKQRPVDEESASHSSPSETER